MDEDEEKFVELRKDGEIKKKSGRPKGAFKPQFVLQSGAWQAEYNAFEKLILFPLTAAAFYVRSGQMQYFKAYYGALSNFYNFMKDFIKKRGNLTVLSKEVDFKMNKAMQLYNESSNPINPSYYRLEIQTEAVRMLCDVHDLLNHAKQQIGLGLSSNQIMTSDAVKRQTFLQV